MQANGVLLLRLEEAKRGRFAYCARVFTKFSWEISEA